MAITDHDCLFKQVEVPELERFHSYWWLSSVEGNFELPNPPRGQITLVLLSLETDALNWYKVESDNWELQFFGIKVRAWYATGCSLVVQSANSGCPVQNNLCAYMFQYGDGSDTPGFFVSDVLQSGIRLILMTLGQTCYLILE
ncbi:hypothetical protein Bca101_057742 [Brassica carinata]